MSRGTRRMEMANHKATSDAIYAARAAEAKKPVHTEASLLAKTNVELKSILASYDGAPAANGKKKAELVEAILAEQAK